MHPVSAEFLKAVKSSHTIVSYADFYRRGELVMSGLPLEGGDVSEDRSAAVRTTCSLAFAHDTEDSIIPLTNDYLSSPLWPIGNEVQLWTGVVYDDGREELVPQGRFRVSRPRFGVTAGEITIGLSGSDRSRAVSRSKLTDSYTILQGSDVGTEVKKVIRRALPMLSEDDFDFIPTDGSIGGPAFTTPLLNYAMNHDPWEIATSLAFSAGTEVFFGGMGKCFLRAQPDELYTLPVVEYREDEDCIVTGLTRDLDDQSAYNGVIAVGESNENTSFIPRAEVWDLNPNSPTYYDPDYPAASLYGPVPDFLSSDLFTTNAHCQAAARARLMQVMGILEEVQFEGICNPAHTAGDVVSIERSEVGVDAIYLLEAVRKSLGVEASMSATTRRRRLT